LLGLSLLLLFCFCFFVAFLFFFHFRDERLTHEAGHLALMRLSRDVALRVTKGRHPMKRKCECARPRQGGGKGGDEVVRGMCAEW
jgi:hypothetical protein